MPGNIISRWDSAALGMWGLLFFNSRFGNETSCILIGDQWCCGVRVPLCLTCRAGHLGLLSCSPPSCPDSSGDWTNRLSLSCMCLTLKLNFRVMRLYFIISTGQCHLWEVWGLVRHPGGEGGDRPAHKIHLGFVILWGLVTRRRDSWGHVQGTSFIHSTNVIKNLLWSWPYSQMHKAWQWSKPAQPSHHGACIPAISWGAASYVHCLWALLVLLLSKNAQEFPSRFEFPQMCQVCSHLQASELVFPLAWTLFDNIATYPSPTLRIVLLFFQTASQIYSDKPSLSTCSRSRPVPQPGAPYPSGAITGLFLPLDFASLGQSPCLCFLSPVSCTGLIHNMCLIIICWEKERGGGWQSVSHCVVYWFCWKDMLCT